MKIILLIIIFSLNILAQKETKHLYYYYTSDDAWTPADLPITDVAFWGESDNVVLNGTLVSQFTDLSGNGNHLPALDTLASPDYTLDGLNGYPIIQFDKYGQHTERMYKAFTMVKPQVLYLVLRTDGWTSGRYYCDGTNPLSMGIRQNTASPQFLLYPNGIANETGLTIGEWKILRIVSDDANSSIRVNLGSLRTGTITSTNMNGLSIGAGANCVKYSLVGVLLLRAVPTASEDAAIMKYFNDKYAIY